MLLHLKIVSCKWSDLIQSYCLLSCRIYNADCTHWLLAEHKLRIAFPVIWSSYVNHMAA